MTMSTETAAEQQQLMIATPNGFEQIERNRFNTGPYANRTMPTQCLHSEPSPAAEESPTSQPAPAGDSGAGAAATASAAPPPTTTTVGGNGAGAGNTDSSNSLSRPPAGGAAGGAGGGATTVDRKPRKRRQDASLGGGGSKQQKAHNNKIDHSDTPPITNFISMQQRSPKRVPPQKQEQHHLLLQQQQQHEGVGVAAVSSSLVVVPPPPPPSIIDGGIIDCDSLGAASNEDSNSQSNLAAAFSAQVAQQEKVKDDLMRAKDELETLKKQFETQRADSNKLTKRVEASRETIISLLIDQSRIKRKQAKERFRESTLRIGQFKLSRSGENFREQWTDGWAMEEVQKKMERNKEEQKALGMVIQNVKRRKTATKDPTNRKSGLAVSSLSSTAGNGPDAGGQASISALSSSIKSAVISSNSSSISSSIDNDCFARPVEPGLRLELLSPQELIEQDEIYRLRKDYLKKEESDLLIEKDRIQRERNLHIREMRRVQNEEASQYRNYEMLCNRYLLLSLLGKGGFSEVWHAFDLDENRYVACKIHQINNEWKEDKKANYVKHATREMNIHMTLEHPRIVRHYAWISIDDHAFCTVLEYCDGNDLDFYLKQHKHIPEKEARIIIMQIVSALKYLNELKNPVIHYDLKPANILLQSNNIGEIKLTDFGLSKTMVNCNDGDESIELTSQGAGTYWYLPPETFAPYSESGAPKISNKVDVWSVGVIFYQCLYGQRPFGHEKTQQQILEERTIFNAKEVVFPTGPSVPKVSSEAQEFIRRCLQCQKEERADVNELACHRFLQPNQKSQKSLQQQQSSSPSSRQQSGVGCSAGSGTTSSAFLRAGGGADSDN